MYQTTYLFEDLPRDVLANGYIASRVSGRALIAFDDDGDWSVDTIWVDADNNRRGARAHGAQFVIPSDTGCRTSLFSVIAAALLVRRKDEIEEQLAEELFDEGRGHRDPNAEHRLSAVQLGVGGR